jgi:hypothetical protein
MLKSFDFPFSYRNRNGAFQSAFGFRRSRIPYGLRNPFSGGHGLMGINLSSTIMMVDLSFTPLESLAGFLGHTIRDFGNFYAGRTKHRNHRRWEQKV